MGIEIDIEASHGISQMHEHGHAVSRSFFYHACGEYTGTITVRVHASAHCATVAGNNRSPVGHVWPPPRSSGSLPHELHQTHVLVGVLLHDLGHSHLEILFRDVLSPLPQGEHTSFRAPH